MEKKAAAYTDHAPTREDALSKVEKKRASEKERQRAGRQTVRPAAEKAGGKTPVKTQVKKKAPAGTAVRKNTAARTAVKKKQQNKKKDMSTKKLILISAFILLSIAGITTGILFALSRSVLTPEPLVLPEKIIIEAGDTAAVISEKLVGAGILADSIDFLNEVDTRGIASELREGSYYFTEETPVDDIVSTLTESTVDITLFPGETIQAIDDRLSSRDLFEPGEFILMMQQVAQERHLPFAEGFLSGITYQGIPRSDIALTLARRGVDAVYALVRTYSQSINESDLSVTEIVTLASMIQRETNDPQQMPLIAGVMMNRLKTGEPLGIDATTRYAIGDWESHLTESDFTASGAYDTRRRKGLPPSGIGAVSENAFKAVLFPAEHDYLFYMHDSQGNLHLARTYSEHLANASANSL